MPAPVYYFDFISSSRRIINLIKNNEHSDISKTFYTFRPTGSAIMHVAGTDMCIVVKKHLIPS